MHILFLSATENQNTNKPALTALKNLKHTVFNGAFSEEMKDKTTHIAQITRQIKKSDAIVVESSTTNFDLGRLLALAIFQHKPILILQQKGKERAIELGNNRLVNTKTYKPEKTDELEKKLKDFMKTVQQQRLTYRFNLMLSRDINLYLSEKAQASAISKADYIRSLIVSDMNDQ